MAMHSAVKMTSSIGYQCLKLYHCLPIHWIRDLIILIYLISALHVQGEGTAICPPGWMPPDCQNPCKSGYFGSDCVFPCPIKCLDKICQPDTGLCYQCQLGFTGPNCSRHCRRGFFGQDCNNTCPNECFRKRCDPFTGLCGRCIPGYDGVRCEIHYSLRNHSNQSIAVSHSIQLKGVAQATTVIYISAGISICVMSVCSAVLCNHLVKLRAQHNSLKQRPIYRKRPRNVLPSALARRLEATAATEYIEMVAADGDECDTTGEADVTPNSADYSAIDGGKCARPTRWYHGKYFNVLTRKMVTGRRGRQRLSGLVKDTDEMILQHNGIKTPELTSILKQTAPLRLEQAANFSRDLYFKSRRPHLRLSTGSCDLKEHVPEQPHPRGSLKPGDQRALAVNWEQSAEADISLETTKVGGKPTAESKTSRYCCTASNSQMPTVGEMSTGPRDTSQKRVLLFNLTPDLSQDGSKRDVRPCPLPNGGRFIASPSARLLQALLHTDDITRPGKTDVPRDETTEPAVTDAAVTRVYADTTEPLTEPGRLLWHARKALASIVCRVVRSRSQALYKVVSHDRKEAVGKLEPRTSGVPIIGSGFKTHDILGKNQCPYPLEDIEILAEETKDGSKIKSRTLEVKGKDNDSKSSGILADYDDENADIINQQQFGGSISHRTESSDLERYIAHVLRSQRDYLSTDRDTGYSTVAVYDDDYSIVLQENTASPFLEPLNNMHNEVNGIPSRKNLPSESRDIKMFVPVVTSDCHFSKCSFVDDATNNFSFCCTNKEMKPADEIIKDGHHGAPVANAVSRVLTSRLPKQYKSQRMDTRYNDSGAQHNLRTPAAVCTTHTKKLHRGSSSHKRVLEKSNTPEHVETPVMYALNSGKCTVENEPYLDTPSLKGSRKTGVIWMDVPASRQFTTNTSLNYLSKKHSPAGNDFYINEPHFATSKAKSNGLEFIDGISIKSEESDITIEKWNSKPMKLVGGDGEREQGVSIAGDLGECMGSKESQESDTTTENSRALKAPTYADGYQQGQDTTGYNLGECAVPRGCPESDTIVGTVNNNPLKSPMQADENPQGKNIGGHLGECVSLIPKSVIAMTVTKQPNREINPVFTGDLDLPLTRNLGSEHQPDM